mgnify:CR=1 FL=1
MKLGVLKEPEGETRVAIVPTSLRKLNKAGFEVPGLDQKDIDNSKKRQELSLYIKEYFYKEIKNEILQILD